MLENYPRDELFQIDENTLYHFALAVLQLDERPRVRVLPRRDRFDRFVSVLVYRAARALRQRACASDRRLSRRGLQGRVSAFYPFFPEGPLVRVHFIIARVRRATPPIPIAPAWSAAVEAIVRTWTDELGDELARRLRSGEGARAVRALSRRFFRRLSRKLFAGYERRPKSGSSRACRRSRPLGVDFHRRAAGREQLASV